MTISKIAVFCALLLGPSCFLRAQATTPKSSGQSCRTFVQRFYDWYGPEALKEKEDAASALNLALTYKSRQFSPELLRLLREDSEAQDKATGQIVGLDFDPFLNSQDPHQRYVVGNVMSQGERCSAEVYGEASGKQVATPGVVAELRLTHGRWLFVNFHYGKSKYSEDETLLSTLSRLRIARQKHSQ